MYSSAAEHSAQRKFKNGEPRGTMDRSQKMDRVSLYAKCIVSFLPSLWGWLADGWMQNAKPEPGYYKLRPTLKIYNYIKAIIILFVLNSIITRAYIMSVCWLDVNRRQPDVVL